MIPFELQTIAMLGGWEVVEECCRLRAGELLCVVCFVLGLLPGPSLPFSGLPEQLDSFLDSIVFPDRCSYGMARSILSVMHYEEKLF